MPASGVAWRYRPPHQCYLPISRTMQFTVRILIARHWLMPSIYGPVLSAFVAGFFVLLSGATCAQTLSGTFSSPTGGTARRDKIAHWNLTLTPDGTVVEEVSKQRLRVDGAVYASLGPAGPSLQFDGYTGALRGVPLSALAHPVGITVVCWVQLNAYPWNDLPILDQQTEAQGVSSGLFFGLDATGHLLARLGGANPTSSVISTGVVPLRTWTLVTLSIDQTEKLSFTIGGKPTEVSATPPTPPAQVAHAGNDLIIGHVRQPLLPGPSALIHPQYPFGYSLEGSLGGLTVYQGVLPLTDIGAMLAEADQKWLAPIPWPVFPRVTVSRNKFGASYTTLHYDPLWERSRHIGPNSDVVVTFDDAPTRLVFWQGTNYVPAWVTENNRWYSDQFMEALGDSWCPDGADCEPMSDKQSRYSHIRILESTPARVVIHWRYALAEAENYIIANSFTPRGWGDWADEYWTVYPDGVAVRKSVLRSTVKAREKAEFQESIVLIPPGQKPEEILNYDALTFANMQGETQTYSWQPKTAKELARPNGPTSFPEPKNSVIQRVNLKSDWKPFEVAWGNPVTLDVYNGEKSISSFEWWNHWPVAQIPSSGRPALAADRAGHTSISHIFWPIYEQEEQYISKILMTGLTRLQAADLVPVAASWRSPARLELATGINVPYDAAQRAYVLPSSNGKPLRMRLYASTSSPAVHPAFVVPGWRGTAEVNVSGGDKASVKARVGYLDGLDGSTLIVYLPLTATKDVVLELRPK